MKATELRLGNIVRANNPQHPPDPEWKNDFHIVYGLNAAGPYEHGDVDVLHIEDDEDCIYPITHSDIFIEPVKITEEWLERLGLRVVNPDLYRYFQVELTHDGLFEVRIEYGPFKVLDYVHELQNLYHAIMDDDLKINEGEHND